MNKMRSYNTHLSNKISGIIYNENDAVQYIENADLIVNTTPIGMHKQKDMTLDEIPLGKDIWKNLKQNTILYDLIYTPRPTKWLKLGLKKDCQIIDGLEMLIQQGAASLRLWSGYQEIPINTMKKSVKKYLLE